MPAPIPAVLDTNVIVAALLGREDGANRKTLRCFEKGAACLVISSEVETEYRGVLRLAETVRGLPQGSGDAVIDTLKQRARLVCSSEDCAALVHDPDDAPFVSAAIAGDCTCLVTNNIRDYCREELLRRFSVRVMKPAEFLTLLGI
jgi:predicted nucleic acid-binding protein